LIPKHQFSFINESLSLEFGSFDLAVIFAIPKKIIVQMKSGIHPENYRFVVFKDMSNNDMFMSRSCVQTKETVQWEDGKEYPLIKLEISNTSHPFFTGKMKLIDTAGRIDKFNKRYAKK